MYYIQLNIYFDYTLICQICLYISHVFITYKSGEKRFIIMSMWKSLFLYYYLLLIVVFIYITTINLLLSILLYTAYFSKVNTKFNDLNIHIKKYYVHSLKYNTSKLVLRQGDLLPPCVNDWVALSQVSVLIRLLQPLVILSPWVGPHNIGVFTRFPKSLVDSEVQNLFSKPWKTAENSVWFSECSSLAS